MFRWSASYARSERCNNNNNEADTETTVFGTFSYIFVCMLVRTEFRAQSDNADFRLHRTPLHFVSCIVFLSCVFLMFFTIYFHFHWNSLVSRVASRLPMPSHAIIINIIMQCVGVCAMLILVHDHQPKSRTTSSSCSRLTSNVRDATPILDASDSLPPIDSLPDWLHAFGFNKTEIMICTVNRCWFCFSFVFSSFPFLLFHFWFWAN